MFKSIQKLDPEPPTGLYSPVASLRQSSMATTKLLHNTLHFEKIAKLMF